MKKIKFIIDSDLESVALVGMSVRKICSLTPFSDNESFQVELCAVEAVNNSIIHAYNDALLCEVEIILTVKEDCLSLEVCDIGKPMNSEVLQKAGLNPFDDMGSVDKISESGRGLGFIKEFMDKVIYKSDDDGNRLVMLKYY